MLASMELVITLLLLGGVLLLLETVLPGMIAGLVGAGCVVAGVILGYVEFGAQTGTWLLVGVSTALVAGFCVWAKLFPESRFGRALISKQVVGELGAEQPGLLNHAGTAFTQLRPSGTALIDGRRIDVVSEGALIEKGTPVKVVAVEGVRVVVRAVTDGSLDTNPSPS